MRGRCCPTEVRPALLWTMELDHTGEGITVQVERALVKSRSKLDYAGVQAADRCWARPANPCGLLKVVGQLREAKESARGGASLPLPDQEISVEGDHWGFDFRSPLPVEGWNAQISLLTGFGAATLMLQAPSECCARSRQRQEKTSPASPDSSCAGHRVAETDGVRRVRARSEPGVATHAAMISACTRVLAWSGYAAFNGESRHRTCTQPWPRRTPMSPPRFGVWSIATRARSVWRSVPMSRCPGGSCRVGDAAGVDAESSRRANAYERAVTDLVEDRTHDGPGGQSRPRGRRGRRRTGRPTRDPGDPGPGDRGRVTSSVPLATGRGSDSRTS